MGGRAKLATILPRMAAVVCALFVPGLARAQSSAGVETRVNVTIFPSGKAALPRFGMADILVFQGNDRRPVVSFVQAGTGSTGLDVVVVIDDAADAGLGIQLRDLASFIRSLPANAQVEVVYAAYGSVRVEQALTTEHEAAAKKLRLPHGALSGASGFYDALRDLAKKWPEDGAARVVLVVGQGLDVSLGLHDTSPEFNEGLQRAIEAFQRGAITAYSVYASDAGHIGEVSFLVTNGQGCLLRLTKETGGESYFNGTRTPIDFGVYLRKIRERINGQYVLTFRARPGKQAGFEKLRVTTELPGMALSAPTNFYFNEGK
jgi:hypothetical protein